MTIKRVFDLLEHYKQKYPNKENVFGYKHQGNWETVGIKDYIHHVNTFSLGLLDLGLQTGDKIATISNNRPEWNITDMALMQIGAIHMPIYPTISVDDYEYILKHANVKYVFVSSEEIYKKIKNVLKQISNIKGVYAFNEIDTIPHWTAILKNNITQSDIEQLELIKASIEPEDMATLIYTSGTTGNPKGVMLSHNNLVSNFLAISEIPQLPSNSKSLSYLPLCHVYERVMNYMCQYLGISIYYAENLATIIDDMQTIKPEVLTTVPRLLERFYDRITMKARSLKCCKKLIFFWAINLSEKFDVHSKHTFCYKTKLHIARKLVYKNFSEALGGQLQIIVSGGAALQLRLAKLFEATGIHVLEGYGLTETSPVIAVNKKEKTEKMLGTVGPLLKNIEVKFDADGEILCKGPNVMLGYYKEPELTAQIIDKDGWLKTGDIGTLVDNKFLKITDRKKSIFKTSTGKYISPLCIENKMKESPFIAQIIVVGENEKFAGALIVPNFEYVKKWCKIKNIPYPGDDKLNEDKKIRNRIKEEVDKYNKFFGNTEHVKKIRLLKTAWTSDSGEFTATLKKKRKFICEKYHNEIKEIFK